jgi:hypothetical protein
MPLSDCNCQVVISSYPIEKEVRIVSSVSLWCFEQSPGVLYEPQF